MRPEIEITMLGGNCPLQGEGRIGGKPFYFRARGQHWEMCIGGADVMLSPLWRKRVRYGSSEFEAGWMGEEEARRIINRCAREFYVDMEWESPR